MPKPILDDKAKQAIEDALAKGFDAKVSNGPNGTIKVSEMRIKLVLDTGKTEH